MKKIAALKDIDVIEAFYDGNLLVFDTHNNLLFISERDGSVLKSIPWKDYCIIKIKDNHIFLLDDGIYKYDETNNSFELYRSSITGGSVNWFGNNVMENNYMRSSKSVCITLFEGDSDRKVWERIYPNRRHWDSRGKYLYVTDLSSKYIDFIDAQSGAVINTLHFENPPISRFIYNYEDTLIVSLNVSRDECHLLGLDARTGEEKWRIENAFNIYASDNATGLFYAISGYFYQVIDVKNGKLVCEDDLSAEMSKFDVIPEAGGCLTEDGIYFRGRMSAKFGLLNIHTHKFEFVEDLGAKNGAWTTNIQYHNGKVYVLDNTDVLHIWGKE